MYLSIIILPLLGSIVSGFFGRKVGINGAQFITSCNVLITTFLAIMAFSEVGFTNILILVDLLRWIDSGWFNIMWNFEFDSLTISMLIPVLIISSLVHIYSISYMKNDPHNQRFFSYLSLFTFMMIILVTANNYLLMFVGWEGVGVCSYLLVSFWFTRIAANQSSLSAFLTNRVGDCLLTIGMFGILWTLGNLDYATIFSLAPYINENIITILGICLLIGAMAKSSQIGLHIWLPMAMEGPTPVSALIHAATMVTAGVYLLMRSSPLIEYSSTLLLICLWLGAITTIFSSLIGLFQQDIKKVIAYSTMSQLGMMVIAVGLSLYNLALFHLINHAFYKALLFLGAGSVIHAIADNQDFRKYGGLINYLPLTYSVMLIASFSLVAFPFMAGFYSKDFILESAYGQFTFLGIAVYTIATIGAIFTTLYSIKVLYLTFLAKPNGYFRYYDNVFTIIEGSVHKLVYKTGDPRYIDGPIFVDGVFVPIKKKTKYLPMIYENYNPDKDPDNAIFNRFANSTTYEYKVKVIKNLYNGLISHEGNLYMTLPLITLAIFSIFFGFIAKDLFIGLGSSFFIDNSLFIHPNHESIINTEFAIPILFKLLPFFCTIFFSLLGIIILEYTPEILLKFKFSNFGYNLFSFFNQRFLIEMFYNKYITRPILNLGGYIAKYLDKGNFELLGPFGLEKSILNISKKISSFHSNIITNYALFIIIGIIIILFLIKDNLDVVLFFTLLMIMTTYKKNFIFNEDNTLNSNINLLNIFIQKRSFSITKVSFINPNNQNSGGESSKTNEKLSKNEVSSPEVSSSEVSSSDFENAVKLTKEQLQEIKKDMAHYEHYCPAPKPRHPGYPDLNKLSNMTSSQDEFDIAIRKFEQRHSQESANVQHDERCADSVVNRWKVKHPEVSSADVREAVKDVNKKKYYECGDDLEDRDGNVLVEAHNRSVTHEEINWQAKIQGKLPDIDKYNSLPLHSEHNSQNDVESDSGIDEVSLRTPSVAAPPSPSPAPAEIPSPGETSSSTPAETENLKKDIKGKGVERKSNEQELSEKLNPSKKRAKSEDSLNKEPSNKRKKKDNDDNNDSDNNDNSGEGGNFPEIPKTNENNDNIQEDNNTKNLCEQNVDEKNIIDDFLMQDFSYFISTSDNFSNHISFLSISLNDIFNAFNIF